MRRDDASCLLDMLVAAREAVAFTDGGSLWFRRRAGDEAAPVMAMIVVEELQPWKSPPLSVHIGAEIAGVDLPAPLSNGEVGAIRDALLTWKVVFFRGQRLDHARHVAFARRFGAPTPAHVLFGGADPDHPEMYSVAKHRVANSNDAAGVVRPWSGWHTDITAAINPPSASILRGETVPPYGGDTQWTSLATAYRALSPVMREFVDGLRGVHRFETPAGRRTSGDYDEAVGSRLMISEHPLVRVHPETGERALYVSPDFLKSVVGLTPAESRHLLEML